MIRLAHFITHPIQYFAPVYRHLTAQKEIELVVLFSSRHGLEPGFDKGFGREIRFDVPLLDGYAHRFLTNRGDGQPSGRYLSHDCPDIATVLREERADAIWIHGWGYRAQWQAIGAAQRLGIPYLMRGETTVWTESQSWLRRLVRRVVVARMLRRAARCLYVGQANRTFYRSMGVPDERLRPAHYSIEAERFQATVGTTEERDALRRQHGAGPDDFVVIGAAKAVPVKRWPDLIQAVAKLPPNCQLWAIGDGPDRPTLERLAADVASGRVRWLGFINQGEMPRYLAAGDVFVLPSDYEPWGLAVNEAMACGLPALCSDRVGCHPDLIREGVTGHVFPAGDVTALAACLERMRQAPEVRRRMGAAAQDLVVREYSSAATARQIGAAVRELLG